MKHIKFSVRDNERLALKGIHSVEIDMTSRLQVFLGTSGSGKSTLLRELSLMPGKPGDYGPNGYKYDLVSHRGSEYELTSDLGNGKTSYQIKKDGTVMYAGHSQKVFAAYIAQEFKVTATSHAISIGTLRFCNMNRETRRQILTGLSPVDYTYALEYYKRLKTAQNHVVGAIDRLSTKIIQEKEKLLSPEDEETLRKEIGDLRKRKELLFKVWRPTDHTSTEEMEKLRESDAALEAGTRSIMQSLSVVANLTRILGDVDSDVQAERNKLEGRLHYLSEKTNGLFDKIESEREQLRNSGGGVDGEEDIDSLITANYLETKELRGTLRLQTPCHDNEAALRTLESILPSLNRTFSELKPDPDKKVSAATIERQVEIIEDLERSIATKKNSSQVTEERITVLEHFKTEGHTTCPACDHKWYRGFDEGEYVKLIEQRGKLAKAIRSETETLVKLQENLQDVKDQYSGHRAITSIIANNTEVLLPVWELIKPLIRATPAAASETLSTIPTDLLTHIEIDQLLKQRKELLERKERIDKASKEGQAKLTASIKSSEEELFSLNEESTSINTRLTQLRELERARNKLDTTQAEMTELHERHGGYHEAAQKANEQEAIAEVLQSLESEILYRVNQINHVDTQHALIKNLESEVDDLIVKRKLMKDAMQALSPTSGLIAKGLVGFINHFIAQMNAIIEKVWTRPLSIRPVTMGEDDFDLTYQFGVNVEDKPAGDDVEETSSGQQEIINLAFMLVYMVRSGMEDFPVFLDEFSARMDAVHRQRSVELVTELLQSSNFSQIFMVSHYENTYGALTTADVTVLCQENIELPPGFAFNTNTKIAYK